MSPRTPVPLLARTPVLFLALALPLGAQTVLQEIKQERVFGSVGDDVGVLGDIDGDGLPELLTLTRWQIIVLDGATGAVVRLIDVDDVGRPVAVAGLRDDVSGDGLPDFVVTFESEDGPEILRAYSGTDGAPLWSWTCLSNLDGCGRVLRAIGDFDGDGVRDVATIVPGNVFAGPAKVLVVSGADGTTALNLAVLDGFPLLQGVDSPGDLDGDGLADLAVSDVGSVDRLIIVSSAGVVAANVPAPVDVVGTFGGPVAALGDLTGDGVPELAVGSPGADDHAQQAGRVDVLDGASGAPLLSRAFDEACARMGQVVAGPGDVDGDGVPDVVVASPYAGITNPPAGKFGDGKLFVLSGVDLSTVLALQGPFAERYFSAVATPGDMTGDGVPDLYVGSIADDDPLGFLGLGAGLARLVSGADGATVHELLTPPPDDRGVAVTLVDDLDRDGVDDVVVLGRTVAVFSRARGALLYEVAFEDLSLSSVDFTFLRSVAPIGDVDGDGLADLAIGAPAGLVGGERRGFVRALSGADGSVLWTAPGVQLDERLGWAVAADDDRDGDGLGEVWASAPCRDVGGEVDAGVVLRLSGGSGAVLDVLEGEFPQTGEYGLTVTSGGDVDDDGSRDVTIGSRESFAPLQDRGRVQVRSGATLALLHVFEGVAFSMQTVGAIVPDLDADGHDDVAVGAPYWDASPIENDYGRVQVFSGDSGALLWSVEGLAEDDRFGFGVAGVGDVDGDGLGDVVATRPTNDAAAMHTLLSGADGTVLETIPLPSWPECCTGSTPVTPLQVGPAGLVDAGNAGEVLIGAYRLGPPYVDAAALVYTPAAGGIQGVEDVGFALAGTGGVAPALEASGDFSAGGFMTVRVRDAQPLAPGAWFIGLAIGGPPFKGGTLAPDPSGGLVTFPAFTDALGTMTVAGDVTPAVFPGFAAVMQMWFVDPGAVKGLSATNGIEVLFE